MFIIAVPILRLTALRAYRFNTNEIISLLSYTWRIFCMRNGVYSDVHTCILVSSTDPVHHINIIIGYASIALPVGDDFYLENSRWTAGALDVIWSSCSSAIQCTNFNDFGGKLLKYYSLTVLGKLLLMFYAVLKSHSDPAATYKFRCKRIAWVSNIKYFCCNIISFNDFLYLKIIGDILQTPLQTNHIFANVFAIKTKDCFYTALYTCEYDWKLFFISLYLNKTTIVTQYLLTLNS